MGYYKKLYLERLYKGFSNEPPYSIKSFKRSFYKNFDRPLKSYCDEYEEKQKMHKVQ